MPEDDAIPNEESQDAAEGEAPTPEEGSVEASLDEAQATLDETQAAVDQAGAEPGAFEMPEFGEAQSSVDPASIDLLSNVNLNVKIELGRTQLLVEDVLKLGEGAVVELDKLAGDPVDIFVNDRHVARGEVLVLNDNFCIRVSEILDAIGDAARDASGAA